MKEKYLPIGTVVLLKEATKKLMITGYCSARPEEADKVYDYVGLLFPEGNLAGDDVALFNHDQIGIIVYMGLVDDEFKQLEKKIKSVFSNDNVGLTMLDTNKVNEEPVLAPFTPDNINNIVSQIKSNVEAFSTVSEPTAFNEEVLKKPDFQMPSLSGKNIKTDEKTEKKNIIEEKGNEEIDTSDLDGQPVLQLQPIFDNELSSGSVQVENELFRL